MTTARQRKVAYAAASSTGTIVAVVLLGWALGRAELTGVLPGLPDMKANTAVSMGLLALSLAAIASGRPRARMVGRLAATAVAVLAAAALSAWLGGPGALLDEMVFTDPLASVAPGRMAPTTAIVLLLLVCALQCDELPLVDRTAATRLATMLGLAAALLSVLPLLGLLFDAGPLYEPLALRGMAPATALAALAITVGLLTLMSPARLRSLLLSDGPGGVLMRRTLPIALVALAAIAYLRVLGERAGWYELGTGMALMVVANGSVLIVLLLTTAKQLERQRTSILEQRFTTRLYEKVLDQSPTAVFVKDRGGRYVVANRATADAMGKPVEAILGRSDHDLFPPSDAARLATNDATVRRTRASVEIEEPLTTARGSRTFLTTKFPIEGPGLGEPLVGGIAADITERQELEHRLAQAERLETVGELAGGVAHDFNNLLTVISGMTELAMAEIGTHPASEALGHTLAAAGRAADLSRELLTFARRDAGRVEGRCHPNRVVRELEALLRPLLGEDVALDIDLGIDVDAVAVTSARLEQVLMNLAVNARDAMPDGGLLAITTRRVHVDAELAHRHPPLQPGPHVSLAVRDTGSGMTQDIQDRALEPFFTTKAPGEGTGLGLASTYGVVTSAGGALTIASAPGSGTSVTLLLPSVAATTAVNDEQEPGPQPWVEGAGRTILVIEDEPAVREVLRSLLAGAGFTVTTAGGVDDARAVAGRLARPDLVVSDVVLRDGAGPVVVEELRRRWAGLPVLYVSGYTERTGRWLQPDDRLLHKPFSAAALYRAVASLIETEAADRRHRGPSPAPRPAPSTRG